MTNTKDIILKLKEVKEEKGLSYGDILDLMEKNGDFISKSTLSRLFAEGSEDETFNYEGTIRPVAKALLDIEDIEAGDTTDTKAMKSLLKYKIERIEELERQVEDLKLSLAEEKVKYHERIEQIHEEHRQRVDFLINQISLKDKRMDQLLNAVFTKDAQHKELLDVIMSSHDRQKTDCTEV